MALKVDLKRELGCYAARVGVFSMVNVPPLQYSGARSVGVHLGA